MKSIVGYTSLAKLEILNKITQIRRSWNDEEALPRKLNIPFTEKKFYLQPYWIMEFRDHDGFRRFFKFQMKP